MATRRHQVKDALEQVSGVSVHTGFPNPATDSTLQNLNLNQLLVWHSVSTFMMEIGNDDWADIGIFTGDVAIIDRALNAQPSDKIAWIYDDRFVLSHISQLPKTAVLWGVVTAVIHRYRKLS